MCLLWMIVNPVAYMSIRRKCGLVGPPCGMPTTMSVLGCVGGRAPSVTSDMGWVCTTACIAWTSAPQTPMHETTRDNVTLGVDVLFMKDRGRSCLGHCRSLAQAPMRRRPLAPDPTARLARR